MNRLQKKCLIAAAGTHLLVVVTVLCSGFITSRPKPDDSRVLDVIPANLIDAALSSGVRDANPPPLAPPVKPVPPAPRPEPQKPEVKPPDPVKPVEPVRPPETFKPAEVTEPKPKPKPKPHLEEKDLKPLVRKKPPVVDTAAADEANAAKAAEKAAQRARDARIRAIREAASSIRDKTSSSMTIDMPGDSTVAYANYGAVVISIYTQAWTLPDTAAGDDTDVKVSVTIANDGRVISAHIVGRSGDAAVNRSVQNTLDRVRNIAPFPDGSTDKERTYIINFNLKAKRQMLG